MVAACLKRFGFVVLAAALALAPAAHAAMAASMATAAAENASALPAPDRCDQCGDGSAGMSAGTCVAACAAAAGLVDSLPALTPAPGLRSIARLPESVRGQFRPPDTGPPKRLPLL